MNNQDRKQRSLLARLARTIIKSLIHPFMHIFDRRDYVCYYPAFDYREDLINHYFRARWYLPSYVGVCTRVIFFKTFNSENPKPIDKPVYMCDARGAEGHIAILQGKLRLCRMILCSREILLWKKITKLSSFIMLLLGKRIHNVNTEDPRADEYRTYPKILWGMLSERQRQGIIDESRLRFTQYTDRLRKQGYKKAYVFGNGPTLEDAYAFEFDDGIRIMCNTVVGNRALLDHVNSHFLVAVDEVFHYGVSCYAEKFRLDLIDTLTTRNLLFVALAQSGFILIANCPELASKTILIPDYLPLPNYDLLQNFWMPGLESVVLCAMLPIAATLADDIRLLGCDGRSPDKDNEDFWAHARRSQYDQHLINSALSCHPTFDAYRQAVNLYERYNSQMALTILTGEQEYGKKYVCLQPSNTPVLSSRLIR